MKKTNLYLKISSGTKKGALLLVPPNTEPVKSIVKQAIFSILGESIKDANCLDLFAGSGNLGLEALSRGASFCSFMDSREEAVRTIEHNSDNLEFGDKASVEQSDLFLFPLDFHNPPNIIFLDPPYNSSQDKVDNVLKNLIKSLNKGSTIVYLHGKKCEYNFAGKAEIDERKFGKTIVSIIKK